MSTKRRQSRPIGSAKTGLSFPEASDLSKNVNGNFSRRFLVIADNLYVERCFTAVLTRTDENVGRDAITSFGVFLIDFWSNTTTTTAW